MKKQEELTLTGLDRMRHLVVSDQIVKAIAFAARAGHGNLTAHRFVTALTMTGDLTNPSRARWSKVLVQIMDLEAGHEHAYVEGDPEEMCAASPECILTYGEYRGQRAAATITPTEKD